MKEILDNFWNWYHSLNIGEILNWVITIGVPTFVAVLTKKLNKAQISEIRAVAENKQVSKNFFDTTNNILSAMANLKDTIGALAQNNEKMNALIMLLLANANIPIDAKQKAIDIYKETQKDLGNKIETSEELVAETITIIEKQVEEEQKVESQPPELDKLVNSFKES